MRILDNITNTPPPDGDYPKSKIADESTPGSSDGVPVNEAVYGDMVQFFQKLIIDGSIGENDLPDNVTNGYQLIDGLVAKINEIVPDSSTALSGYDYIGNARLPLTAWWATTAALSLFNRERGGLVIVSARVQYIGTGLSGDILPVRTVASGERKICDIVYAPLQLQGFPSGLNEKYFRVLNETQGTSVMIGINNINEVFIAHGAVAVNDYLNMQFSFM